MGRGVISPPREGVEPLPYVKLSPKGGGNLFPKGGGTSPLRGEPHSHGVGEQDLTPMGGGGMSPPWEGVKPFPIGEGG